jgi:transcriptional regulator with XRE-family HTH domain
VQFGAHLRALRRAAGLSQEELAARAGLTANGVSALERGVRTRPYPHTVRSLADALDLTQEERDRLLVAAETGGPDPQGPVDATAPMDAVASPAAPRSWPSSLGATSAWSR